MSSTNQALAPLRADVSVEPDGDTLVLRDALTGFTCSLPAAAGAVLPHLGSPRAAQTAALARALGADAPAEDELEQVVSELMEQLNALGLLEQGRSRADIDRAQKRCRAADRAEERLVDAVATVTRAYEQVPLHRERMDQAGVTPADLIDAGALRRIPPLTKAEVRRAFPDGLVAKGQDVKRLLAEGRITIGATSGTSEERLQVLFDWTRGGLPERAHDLWGLEPNAPLKSGAVFTTPVCAGFECHLGSSTPQERTRGSTLTLNSSEDVFGLSDVEIRAIVGELADHKPDVIFLHPWYGAWLSLRARALGLTLHRPTVVLTSYQLLTRRHQRMLREAFGAPVFSYWGATDLGGSLLGAECREGAMHLREDQVFVEVEAPPGERGTALVTLLHEPIMPLVRYRIADVVRLLDEPCACPLGGEWQTVELCGRARDCLAAADGRLLTPRDVDLALGDDGPDFWRLTQTARASYTLEVLGALGEAPQARLTTLLGAQAALRVVSVRRFSPERSLKFRQTLSELGSPLSVGG